MLTGVADVLLLTPALDGYDGISAVSRLAVDALVAEGHAVEVWALDGGAPDGLSPAVTFQSAAGRRATIGAWSVARAARRLEGRLVVVMHVHLAPLGLAMQMRGARLAVFMHGIEVWRRLRVRERAAIERANVLVANSRWTAAQFKAANPAWAGRTIRICHLGIPAPLAAPELPIVANYALVVGRLAAGERYKGHDALIDAWPAVLRQVPAARLVVVGDGDDRGRLEALVRDRGLEGVVVFAGRVSQATLEGWYRSAAFFAMPSTGEGFGLAYLEAMRAGKPCLGGPGAPAEIIEHGETGFIVDPSDTAALTAALIDLFSPERQRTMGAAAAARVAERFEQRHFNTRWLEALGPIARESMAGGVIERAAAAGDRA